MKTKSKSKSKTKHMTFEDLKVTMMMRLMKCDRKAAKGEIARRTAARLAPETPPEAPLRAKGKGKRSREDGHLLESHHHDAADLFSLLDDD